MTKPIEITIERGSSNGSENVSVGYEPHTKNERPTALDVLLQAQEREFGDLAYRYGCRNGLCGVCTIEINGKPKLACRTKVRSGDHLRALSTLPRLQDLVVNRESVNRQLQGRLPVNTVNKTSVLESADALQSLNRCIECYACLDGCPMHAKNSSGQATHGNPYALLKIQQHRSDPRANERDQNNALQLAKELGLDTCLDCKGCRCGVGIDLNKEVIKPLLDQLKQEQD